MADSRKQRDVASLPQPGQSAGRTYSPSSSNPTDADPETYDLLRHVFGELSLSSEASAAGTEKALGLHNIEAHIDKELSEVTAIAGVGHHGKGDSSDVMSDEVGRIGPPTVQLDTSSSVGMVISEPDKLGLSSQSNFSTTRANCCVYKGKWVYELMLRSKGVMQLGWCTYHCKFSQEEGVGDTADSYAYDGSRLRKWNVKTQKYGENWLSGDVISCAIDCDSGSITFYRNGHSLGVAFDTVKTGRGYAYFPAVSLSQQESLRTNFGATPLRYPLDGYRPLQSPPLSDMIKAQHLFSKLENLLPPLTEAEKSDEAKLVEMKLGGRVPTLLTESRSHRSTCLLLAAHIFDKLAPLLKNPYIVECCLLKFLLKFCDSKAHLGEQLYVTKLLDLMWTLMQESELKLCLENLAIRLLSKYRFAPVTPDFKYPKMYLTLTLAVLTHQNTRRYLLSNVLFDKIRFPIFLYIKPLDDTGLTEAIPYVWWDDDTAQGTDADHPVETGHPSEQSGNCTAYKHACDLLRHKIEEIEELQVEIVKVLLIHTDVREGTTTRIIFLSKFRNFLKENTGGSRLHPVNPCPLAVSLCFFHRLVQALRYYWDDFVREDPSTFVLSKDAFLPMQFFFRDTTDYFDFQRCGGLMSHLNKTLGTKVNQAQGLLVTDSGQVIQAETMLKALTLSAQLPQSMGAAASTAEPNGSEEGETCESYPSLEMPSGNSLMELLDGVIILYQIAAHKQLGKTCALRDSLKEYVTSVKDTTNKLTKCPSDEHLKEVREELGRAQSVFTEKLTEMARQMGWFIAVTYSKNKRRDISWLFLVVLRTIEKADKYGDLFQFVPEFYMDVCINACNALRHYFHPTLPYEEIEGCNELFRQFGIFLVRQFADSRIVNTDIRDNIVQALACFTCYSESLNTLETLSHQDQSSMIKSLVAPYENRSWAQTNWILVRIWKGDGFGFRYNHLPHLVPSKHQPTEFGSASLQNPCPSKIFQQLLAQTLLQDNELATKFLDTLLNQLNWSFSEFIGMMQEIQQVVSRPEIRILDSRQIKICATCFEISVSLMRVVEMVVTVASPLFTNWKFPLAELLLGRLIQLLCQVLNRVTSRSGMFENVVSQLLPGLESVTHYPIVAAVVGILIQLSLKTKGECQERVSLALISEAGFQLSSIEFLLGGTGQEAAKPDQKVFTFRKYQDVSGGEVEEVERLITHLRKHQNSASQHTQPINEEELCTICYANKQTAVFQPCGHKSCRKCISQHLMSKTECFFCKLNITKVINLQD